MTQNFEKKRDDQNINLDIIQVLQLGYWIQLTHNLGMRTSFCTSGQLYYLLDTGNCRITVLVLSLGGLHEHSQGFYPHPHLPPRMKSCHGRCREQMLRENVITGQWPEVLVGFFHDMAEIPCPVSRKESKRDLMAPLFLLLFFSTFLPLHLCVWAYTPHPEIRPWAHRVEDSSTRNGYQQPWGRCYCRKKAFQPFCIIAAEYIRCFCLIFLFQRISAPSWRGRRMLSLMPNVLWEELAGEASFLLREGFLTSYVLLSLV